MKTTKKYILSLDGGGIRGIIPIYALMKLEKEHHAKIRDIFSFVAGTSTGAIITGAIAAGIPMEKLLDLYVHKSKEIFTKRPWNIVKRILQGYMYSTKGLYSLVSEELGDVKNWTINDSPIDLLITAKRVSDGMPLYFVRDNKGNSCKCGDTKLTDCITASAAAPTYFYPWRMPDGNLLVDGGVGIAGNPVYQACVEAFYYTGNYIPKDTTVISFGTGRFSEEFQPHTLADWLNWVLKELLNSPGEQQTELVQRHFPELLFYRLDPDFHDLDPHCPVDIPLDGTEYIDITIDYAKRFASLVDWKSLLEGSNTIFKVTDEKTHWKEYKRP